MQKVMERNNECASTQSYDETSAFIGNPQRTARATLTCKAGEQKLRVA